MPFSVVDCTWEISEISVLSAPFVIKSNNPCCYSIGLLKRQFRLGLFRLVHIISVVWLSPSVSKYVRNIYLSVYDFELYFLIKTSVLKWKILVSIIVHFFRALIAADDQVLRFIWMSRDSHSNLTLSYKNYKFCVELAVNRICNITL